MDDNTNKKQKLVPLEDPCKNMFKNNSKYLEMKKHKFWHLAEEKRRLFSSISDAEAVDKAFNADYVNVHSFPPLSALRIKNKSAYSSHPSSHLRTTKTPNQVPTCSTQQVQSSEKPADDDPSTIHYVCEETFEYVEQLTCPHKLMYLTDFEEETFKFTIEQKIGIPMYEKINDKKPENSELSDVLKSKVFSHNYTPRRTVAPPEYPFAYYRLRRNQECIFCSKVGKDCHNVRYGMYLSTLVTRYFKENMDTYNEFDAVKLFTKSYRVICEFETYLDYEKMNMSSEDIILPECLAFDSLVFALNSVEWDIMWGKTDITLKKGKEETESD